MLARDHALSGALVFTAVAPVLHVSGPALLAGAVFTAGAATAPDIDEHGSTISRTLGFFTETVSWLVHKISGGHRKGTHSILGVAVFTFAAWLAVTHATCTAPGVPRRDRYAVRPGPTCVSSHSCRVPARAKNSTRRAFACGVASHVPAGHSRQAMRPFIRSRSIRG